MKKNAITYIKGFIYGLVFGLTVLIPGISVGTIAVVLNVYEKFFRTVNINLNSMKRHLDTIIPFCIGCVCGVALLSNVIMFLLVNHRQIMYFCFMGMIIGCVPMIFKRIRTEEVKLRRIAVFAIALAIMLILAFNGSDSFTNQSLVQLGGITPGLLIWLFVTGVISAIAMLIPGISGSIIMLSLGTYKVSVEAITTYNFAILVVVGAGILIGLLIGIKLIKMLLQAHAQVLYWAILGLVIGSVFTLYPGFSTGMEGALSIIFGIGFAVLPSFLSKKGPDN